MSAPLEAFTAQSPFRQRADSTEPAPAGTSWPVGRLDVRFDSEEALHRAVALLDGQTWVEDCRIDLGARTLHLRLARGAGAGSPGFTLAAPGASAIH